ncbi:hypothetical protein FIA58_020605 [Flavobacterium jejuense]|uniref:RHS repeat-associated core domain-containing protein n=1 Tax=Flavobacterium jejuense TaxID=1544455 RepID=A0ABX0IX07_9FLAO|nr:hypothetical protein [Flavobacterium jejuense]NHN28086.1 hypothetical protein [Flavobacterium jejuense]
MTYQYKYQGQERQTELDLNWDSYKYRNYDYAIGRFMCIDPLAEDYTYNSPYAFSENKIGMGTELEGKELNLHPWLQADATINPNGFGAHMIGFSNGVGNFVSGIGTAISNPKQTATSLMNITIAGAVQGNSFAMMGVDNALGTNSYMTSQAVSQNLEKTATDLVSGDGLERGAAIGEIAGMVLGAKGLNATMSTISSTIKASGTTSLFRAVSGAELTDALSNGLRTTAGGYETSKLFTTSAENASKFGQLNYTWDKVPNTIIKVGVPNKVMKYATPFTADGMPAIAIPAEQLQNIRKISPLNFSPIN